MEPVFINYGRIGTQVQYFICVYFALLYKGVLMKKCRIAVVGESITFCG